MDSSKHTSTVEIDMHKLSSPSRIRDVNEYEVMDQQKPNSAEVRELRSSINALNQKITQVEDKANAEKQQVTSLKQESAAAKSESKKMKILFIILIIAVLIAMILAIVAVADNDQPAVTSAPQTGELYSTCSVDSDCSGTVTGSACIAALGKRHCDCAPGFKLNIVNGRNTCQRVMGGSCLLHGDCTSSVLNSVCGNNGECTCAPGFAMDNVNAPVSCKRVLYGVCSVNQNSCSTSVANSICVQGSVGTMCACASGFKVNDVANPTSCNSVLGGGGFCLTNADCSAAIANSICDTATKLCICSAGFKKDNVNTPTSCQRVLTQACVTTTDCSGSVANSFCDPGSKTCVCNAGFKLDNAIVPTACKRVLGQSCSLKCDCATTVTNSECSPNGLCQCAAGFKVDNAAAPTTCNSVINGACAVNLDCHSNVVNSHCIGGKCICPAGFQINNVRASCDNINECNSSPCLNNGSCNDGVNSYTCSCAPGFSGTNCEININECATNPCQNSGTCIDGINSYTCTCPSGFSGTNCDAGLIPTCQNIPNSVYVSNMCYFYTTATDSYISGATQDCKDIDSRAKLAEIRHTSTQDEIAKFIQQTMDPSSAYYRVGGHYNPGWNEETNHFNEVKWNEGDWEPTQFSWYPTHPVARYGDNSYNSYNSLTFYVTKDSSSIYTGMFNCYETCYGAIASLCQVAL